MALNHDFQRTLRLFEADGHRATLLMLAAASLLIAGWGAWLTLAEVAVSASSLEARLEVRRGSYDIASSTGGPVSASHLELGRAVRAGDVLVTVETEHVDSELEIERMRLAEFELRMASVETQLEGATRQIETQERRAAAWRLEDRQTLESAQLSATLAKTRLERERELREHGLSSDVQVDEARIQMQREDKEVAVLRSRATRRQAESDADITSAKLQEERLHGQLTELDGERSRGLSRIELLGHELEHRILSAPVDGILAAVAELQPGSLLTAGEVIATIVPHAPVMVIAQLDAATALGRVAPGQPAELRLDGFPWTQYGTLKAEVSAVSSELRDGLIRVELVVLSSDPSLPLQHGLPGRVDIEVERTSPAALLLRAVGRRVDGIGS